MAPTEEGIVRSFLLQKAALRDVLTMAEFTSFFPPSKRTSPLVRDLYRDLQAQRTAVCEGVLKQLHLECRFGDNFIAQARSRRQNPQGDDERASMEQILDSQVDQTKRWFENPSESSPLVEPGQSPPSRHQLSWKEWTMLLLS
jgi:Cnl2/NKP2 family protein